MIDRTREHLIPLARAFDEECLWPEGKTPHPATIARWARKGCRGVRLESLLIGGRRFSTVEAVSRFLSRLSEGVS
jgi:hypothetical protein